MQICVDENIPIITVVELRELDTMSWIFVARMTRESRTICCGRKFKGKRDF